VVQSDGEDEESVSVADPTQRLAALVKAGTVKADPIQEAVAGRLAFLHHGLGGWAPEAKRPSGWRGFFKRERKPAPDPRGIYLHGRVGRGKSMLMDLFFKGAPVLRKRRVHFHAFMQETHHRLHAWRQRTKGSEADPLPMLAGEIAETAWLLCFDEFVVNDIADAMILGRLFEALFEAGVVVVATSNVAPVDLYRDGLQRERFLPFIDLLCRRVDVVSLDGPTDYRLNRLAGRPIHYHPDDEAAAEAMDQAWADLTDGAAGRPTVLAVNGRQLQVPREARGVARFTFADLCRAALGPADFLALAEAYPTIMVEHVPILTLANQDEARRFVTLVDALYEKRARLVCSAAAAPDQLCPDGRVAFEFQRTASRLFEMGAADYLTSVASASAA
jgi:cell division protein ZapE